MDTGRRYFVIVFALGGKLFTDYGWAKSDAQFLRDIRYRVSHPEHYPKYTGLPTTYIAHSEIRDITDHYDPSRKDAGKKAAIAQIVGEMKRVVGTAPVK
jgi:hypothetical protein